jgi:carbamoyl-phosphate synthase large subunit
VSVKEAVLPFNRFPEVDTALGPEMRSTGEVMGIDATFGRAFIKAESAAGTELPASGRVFLSLNDRDKAFAVELGRALHNIGCSIVATAGTARVLGDGGVNVESVVGKVSERRAETPGGAVSERRAETPGGAVSERRAETPNHKAGGASRDAVHLIEQGEIAFVINTPQASGTHSDGEAIRKAANVKGVALVTTVRAARAAVQGMRERRESPLGIRSLQEYHGKVS